MKHTTEQYEYAAIHACIAAEQTKAWGWNAAVRYAMNRAVDEDFNKAVGKKLYCLARRLKYENESGQPIEWIDRFGRRRIHHTRVIPAFLQKQAS